MSFLAYAQDPINELVSTAGAEGKVTLIVGAGASMEAGLPSWEGLLDRLLLRGGASAGLIDPIAPGDEPSVDQAGGGARRSAGQSRTGGGSRG